MQTQDTYFKKGTSSPRHKLPEVTLTFDFLFTLLDLSLLDSTNPPPCTYLELSQDVRSSKGNEGAQVTTPPSALIRTMTCVKLNKIVGND